MKTIKTEIHNKPITATHYRDECNEYEFSWVKFNNNSMFVWDDTYWDEVEDDNFEFSVKPIKTAALENQMNIDNLATQTPEEKEELGNIGGTVLSGSDFVSMKEVHLHDHQKKTSPANSEGVNEWINGDKCRYNDINWLFCGFHPVNRLAIVANNDEPSSHQIITVDVELLSKPESPQQREERERLEAAYDLYCTGNKGLNVTAPCAFDEFKSDEVQCKFWLAIVDKTNYRKESN